MTNEALQNLINSWYPDPIIAGLDFTEEESQFLNISIQPSELYRLMKRLKTNSETNFDYLFCLTGVDWGKELGVVYHLESTVHRHIIVV